MRDCLFVVADKNTEFLLRGFLGREGAHLSLGCRPFQWDPQQDLIVCRGQSDPGMYTRLRDLVQPFARDHASVVAIMDAAWEGAPAPAQIRQRLVEHLVAAGWTVERVCAIVIEPELEAWFWMDSPHVEQAVRWSDADGLRAWLAREGRWPQERTKPLDPKETLEWVCRRCRTPRSSSVYQKVASRVSLAHCVDPEAGRLVETLRRWFPAEYA